MANAQFSDVDEYGFRRGPGFNYETLERVMSGYVGVLARRQGRWDHYVKNNGSDFTMTRVLKRFIRKGVPFAYRKTVWFKSCGAWSAQASEPHLYADLLRMNHDPEIADAIKIDLPRTFPNNIRFIAMHNQLFNILIAFSNYDRRVGYCQGLNYIAGILLLICKDEETSFWLLKHLVQEVTPDYHIKTMSGLVKDVGVLAELIRTHVPEVYRHVQEIGLSWAVIVTKWFICLFAEVLPTETVLRIWDCIFCEGTKIMFRVALTLVILFRKEIVATNDILELSNCFKSLVDSDIVNDCHGFLKLIFDTTKFLRRSEIHRLRGVVGQSGLM